MLRKSMARERERETVKYWVLGEPGGAPRLTEWWGGVVPEAQQRAEADLAVNALFHLPSDASLRGFNDDPAVWSSLELIYAILIFKGRDDLLNGVRQNTHRQVCHSSPLVGLPSSCSGLHSEGPLGHVELERDAVSPWGRSVSQLERMWLSSRKTAWNGILVVVLTSHRSRRQSANGKY